MQEERQKTRLRSRGCLHLPPGYPYRYQYY